MGRAIVEVRSQKSRGRGPGRFGGPDIYIAVQIVPDGVDPLISLRADMAEKRGIEIRYFGEGYSLYKGPRSAYGKALAAAQEWAATYNREGDYHSMVDSDGRLLDHPSEVPLPLAPRRGKKRSARVLTTA